MAQIKGGSVADFGGSMAEAIEQALQKEWQAVKGVALPQEGQEDRRLLFVAIARGVLNYLKAHQDEVLSTITLETGGTQTTHQVQAMELNAPAP
jgi:hypothetical protein